jgi:hypothetical protein
LGPEISLTLSRAEADGCENKLRWEPYPSSIETPETTFHVSILFSFESCLKKGNGAAFNLNPHCFKIKTKLTARGGGGVTFFPGPKESLNKNVSCTYIYIFTQTHEIKKIC